MRAIVLVLPTALALAACGTETSGDPAPPVPPPGAQGDPAAVARAADAAGSGIPEVLQGRWGMVPADCEPGRPDAKGLLVIDATTLEFYESRAVLADLQQRTASRIRAGFAFTGEGMEWDREMEMVTNDGGRTMVRREFGTDAMEGALEYARCT